MTGSIERDYTRNLLLVPSINMHMNFRFILLPFTTVFLLLLPLTSPDFSILSVFSFVNLSSCDTFHFLTSAFSMSSKPPPAPSSLTSLSVFEKLLNSLTTSDHNFQYVLTNSFTLSVASFDVNDTVHNSVKLTTPVNFVFHGSTLTIFRM
ncbi:hypothetical protein OTU49_016674 [Cherax quadricarinatus]|uniref:Uncharacterized protein n=1 Tax=Cherax quadricarinatus TaxID=27406 RepID=A0AAW0Y577_CHEQU